MQDHNLVEKTIDVQRVLILDEIHRVLTIEIYYDIASVAGLPVYLNYQVIVSWIQLHSHSPITIAVNEVIDISSKLVGRFVYLEYDQPRH